MASKKNRGPRKTGSSLQSSPSLPLLIDEPSTNFPRKAKSSVWFKRANENGGVRWPNRDDPNLHFHYVNAFYGSCAFEAQIVEQSSLPLKRQKDSVILENYEVKRGNLPLLLQIAQTFFRGISGKCNSVHQLMNSKIDLEFSPHRTQ